MTAHEDQISPAASPQQTSPPASRWRKWDLLLRILGLAVALVGGGALSIPSPLPLAVWIFQPVLLGLIAALLLRSWWALLIVPVTFLVGFFVDNAYQMHGFDLQAWFTGGLGDVDIVLPLILAPTVVGAAIGTPIGILIEWRMRR